ncbi:MAG: beta-galactosidase, partial [Tannerellaceae bacterium]|nr:beta-galactosidase [Tannerellaceae bacterium]
MKKFLLIGMIASLIFPVYCLAQNHSPFGVGAHLQSGEEHLQMPQNLQMIHEAGIAWMRTDFSWSGVESPQGNWHYDHLDKMVEELEKADIRILGLLLFSVDWANPAYEHLDAWLEYVERTVRRYRGRVQHWEIWNEPNLSRFWNKPGGDPLAYTRLLEVTYKKIKEIDPQITVLYAGTAGIPYEFLEKSFEAGAGDYFDLLSIHPYRPFINSVERSVQYYDELERLRKLMAKYKIDKKKIWITEMG